MIHFCIPALLLLAFYNLEILVLICISSVSECAHTYCYPQSDVSEVFCLKSQSVQCHFLKEINDAFKIKGQFMNSPFK